MAPKCSLLAYGVTLKRSFFVRSIMHLLRCGYYPPNYLPLTIDQKRSGNKLILWTCRAGEALEKAVSWCREHQLEFDAINDNLPEIVEMYGNNSRKITCDYYIDDKAVLPAMVNA